MARLLAMAAWSVIAFGLSLLTASTETASADDGSLFRDQVAPLLAQNCISCHGPSQPKGKLSLVAAESTLAGGESGAAVKPGKPDESLLIQYISGDKPEMPKDKPPLSKEQVALIGRWVAEGVVWPKGLILKDNRRADASWWSLQPLSKAEPPSPQGIPEVWAKHTIDRFIYDELAKHHLKPSPEADRRTLIRRLTFDLTGLPPAPEEVGAFLADRSPDAYEKLVDRLLASPRYGERWGRHWLDVIRFGESNGYERNHLHDNAWPFRDYIIRSFNDDKPYDRLVIEQLAGDQLEPGNPDVEVGTGFIVAGSYDGVENSDPAAAAQIHANMLDDTIAATSTAFLGLTINCARCHDHKFDPIPQADYYRLQSAFAGMDQGTRPLANAEQRKKFAADRKQFDEKRKTKPPQPIDEPRLPEAWIGHFHQPGEPTYLMKGGDPQKHGETIAPASLSVLEKVAPSYTLPVNAPEGQRRLALARWIVDRANPLTPRVLVNRLWHYHFGRGIVATPNDFGFQGIRPTHPQLLDWLARQLLANDWRIKPLHRLIVTSQTYRQSSRFEASMAVNDADSLYLRRFPPRRLEAEAIRDAMLSVAGKLDLTMGGPGFRLFDYRVDNVAVFAPRDQFGPETYRRSIYHQNPRSVRVDLLGQFDCPDFSLPTPKRDVTVSPLQALSLENHAFTLDMSRYLAERLEHDVPNGSPADRVRRAFQLAVARPPEPDEMETCVRMITKHGLPLSIQQPLRNLKTPSSIDAATESDTREMLHALNARHAATHPGNSQLQARMAAYDLAARMQLSAPEISDLTRESKATHQHYGTDDRNPLKAAYAKNCLLARRLLERDVRYVTLYCASRASGADGLLNWDAHKTLKADYERHCPIFDQPTAALLIDLKSRGLLHDTLVLWTTEFGRRPTSQAGTTGRDHNPDGFTVWLMGAGVRSGVSYGATDEFGRRAVEKVSTVYDLYATVLHTLGLDYKRLSYYHNGLERRLTDVHGSVIQEVLA